MTTAQMARGLLGKPPIRRTTDSLVETYIHTNTLNSKDELRERGIRIERHLFKTLLFKGNVEIKRHTEKHTCTKGWNNV